MHDFLLLTIESLPFCVEKLSLFTFTVNQMYSFRPVREALVHPVGTVITGQWGKCRRKIFRPMSLALAWTISAFRRRIA